MSKLTTKIPVDVQAVLSALPPNSFVHSVKLNDDKSGIDIVWDNPAIKTAFTFPVNYPLAEIMKRVDKPKKSGKP